MPSRAGVEPSRAVATLALAGVASWHLDMSTQVYILEEQ